MLFIRHILNIGFAVMHNHQIEGDASPALLRTLARAPHLERWAAQVTGLHRVRRCKFFAQKKGAEAA